MSGIMIFLIVVILAALLVVGIYNRIVGLNQRGDQAFADIDVQLRQRHDLIPNLVETVKGYASHERGTLDAVIKARNAASAAHGPAAQAQAEGLLNAALGKLFALAEAYPDLKANTNFLELQRELSDTENKIQAARRFYNSVVQELQNALQQFPSNIIGSLFAFKPREFFALAEGEEAARNPVKVQF